MAELLKVCLGYFCGCLFTAALRFLQLNNNIDYVTRVQCLNTICICLFENKVQTMR